MFLAGIYYLAGKAVLVGGYGIITSIERNHSIIVSFAS